MGANGARLLSYAHRSRDRHAAARTIDGHTHLLIDIVVPAEVEINRTFNGEFEPGMQWVKRGFAIIMLGAAEYYLVLMGQQLI